MTDYVSIVEQATALLAGRDDLIANAANLASLLFHSLDEVNWVGFYFLKGDELIVGPFQGRPACVAIPVGRGVCGTAAEHCAVQRVADVHTFDGHIACDVAARSEIDIPLIRNGDLIGVLDLDSPVTDRFDQDDETFLLNIATVFIKSLG